MAGLKILILFIVFQNVSSRSLFKEVHMKRNFEFSIHPHPLLPFKPITFSKQKLINFGHAIVKRSPFELALPEKVGNPDLLLKAAVENELEEAGTPLLPPPPPPPVPPEGMFTPAPEISSPAPASVPSPIPGSTVLVTQDYLSRLPLEDGPDIIVITPIPPSHVPVTPPPPIVSIPPAVPPPPAPIPGPPPPPVVSIPTVVSPPLAPIPRPPSPVPPADPKGLVQSNLLTDIARVDEINAYLKAVEALGVPPPPSFLLPPPELPPSPPPIEAALPVLTSNSIEIEVPKSPTPPEEKPGPLVKGSRLALYFGNILLQVMSEVISSARSAISQYSPPAPI